MTDVTVTLDDAVLAKAQDDAARQGKELPQFLADLIQRTVGRRTSDLDVVEAFLAGPSLPLTRNGRAPTTDEIYE